MKALEKENDTILEKKSSEKSQSRMSKKRKAKIDKIKNDSSLSEKEKEALIA